MFHGLSVCFHSTCEKDQPVATIDGRQLPKDTGHPTATPLPPGTRVTNIQLATTKKLETPSSPATTPPNAVARKAPPAGDGGRVRRAREGGRGHSRCFWPGEAARGRG